MASGFAALGAVFALTGGWIGPGLAVATALGLGRDRLERVVLGVAVGRVLLTIATLVAANAGSTGALVAWGALGTAAGVWAIVHTRRDLPSTGSGVGSALAVAVGCALLLGIAVVARSGLDHGSVSAFYGRDGANDPFVYGAYAIALGNLGLPPTNPFAGGTLAQGSYAVIAVLAGLAAIGGVPMPDLAYRVVPLFEATALMATAIAFVRALGAPRAAWLLAPVAVLAGDPSPLVTAVARGVGLTVHSIDGFAFFGPYLLAMNPITPGLQTFFCASILLVRPDRRHHAWLAGLLIGALFEIKLFLWAPVVAGLGATALIRPPAAHARSLRIASLVAVLASLPSLADKLLARANDAGGFSLCPGCLPRYLARAAWGDGALSFEIFRSGVAWTSLSPRVLVASLLASAAVAAIALGARALALPTLLRGARRGEAVVVYRILAFASVAGLLLAMTIGVSPHYLNAAQFAWVAVFGLAPLLAIACAEWLRAGRWQPLAAVVLLALPGSADAILRLGFGAPQRFGISRAERDLCLRLAQVSAPGDVVFEPSMLLDTDRPSAIPLLAGRPVYLSLLSAVGTLPAEERDARYEALVAFFVGRDAEAARAALVSSGARFVLVPPGVTPAASAMDGLEPIADNAAGRLYRVPDSATVAP
jgi:hypothetical protein